MTLAATHYCDAAGLGARQWIRQSRQRHSWHLPDCVSLEPDQPEVHGDAIRPVLVVDSLPGRFWTACRVSSSITSLPTVLRLHGVAQPAGLILLYFLARKRAVGSAGERRTRARKLVPMSAGVTSTSRGRVSPDRYRRARSACVQIGTGDWPLRGLSCEPALSPRLCDHCRTRDIRSTCGHTGFSRRIPR